MGDFTTKEIEEISIEKLGYMIRKTGKAKIDRQFDSNDKGPSWDGFLYIHDKEKSLNKGDISSRIPVQIKGTEVKKISNKFLSYTMQLSDLKNYLHDGGVIFIVVQIKGREEEYRIFYKALLPMDIQFILDQANEKENNNTINVKLDGVLHEKVDFYKVCKNFEINREHQGIAQVKRAVRLEEVDFKSIEFFAPRNPLELLNKRIYTYVRDEYQCLIPIKDNIIIDEVIIRTSRDLIIDGKKYFAKFQEHHNNEGVYYSFGDVIIMDGSKITIKPSEGNILERIKSLSFIIEGFYNNYENKNIQKDQLELIENLQSEKEFIEKIIEVCEKFNFNKNEIKIKDLTVDDFNAVDLLYDSESNGIDLIKVKSIGLEIVTFVNKKILLLHIVSEEGHQYYDYYSDELNILLISKEKKKLFMSRYFTLKREHLLCDNFNKNTIIKSFEDINSKYEKEIAEQYIYFVLELIKAWDENYNVEYIELAEYVLEYIKGDIENDILEINRAQIEIRMNEKLGYETIKKLIKVSDITKDSSCKAAIYILLKDRDAYEKEFENLTQEEKDVFIQYPIYNLLD